MRKNVVFIHRFVSFSHASKIHFRKLDARKLFGFSCGTSGASQHTVLVDDSSSEDEQPKYDLKNKHTLLFVIN